MGSNPGHPRAHRREGGSCLRIRGRGKGCADALPGQGARVIITEVDPICALQAPMDGYQVCTSEEVLDYADIYVTTTGCLDVITANQMRRMKDQAIVSNNGQFDNKIDMARLAALSHAPKKINIKPHVDECSSPPPPTTSGTTRSSCSARAD